MNYYYLNGFLHCLIFGFGFVSYFGGDFFAEFFRFVDLWILHFENRKEHWAEKRNFLKMITYLALIVFFKYQLKLYWNINTKWHWKKKKMIFVFTYLRFSMILRWERPWLAFWIYGVANFFWKFSHWVYSKKVVSNRIYSPSPLTMALQVNDKFQCYLLFKKQHKKSLLSQIYTFAPRNSLACY